LTIKFTQSTQHSAVSNQPPSRDIGIPVNRQRLNSRRNSTTLCSAHRGLPFA